MWEKKPLTYVDEIDHRSEDTFAPHPHLIMSAVMTPINCELMVSDYGDLRKGGGGSNFFADFVMNVKPEKNESKASKRNCARKK